MAGGLIRLNTESSIIEYSFFGISFIIPDAIMDRMIISWALNDSE